jgi:hypothetical protein
MTRATVLLATLGIVAIGCGGKITGVPTPSPDPEPGEVSLPTGETDLPPGSRPGEPSQVVPAPREPSSDGTYVSAYPATVQAACGAPVIDILDCATSGGYEVSTYRPKLHGAPEVNVIGVYETRSDHSYQYHPRGEATVKVTRHAKQVLVLSSYESTHWTVSLDQGADVEKVITFGYYEQPVTFEGGSAPVEHLGYSCGYVFPENGQGCETSTLFMKAEKSAQSPVAAFAGCYRANTFVVRDDSEICN